MIYLIVGMGLIGWVAALWQLRRVARLENSFYHLCLLLEEHLDEVQDSLTERDRKLHKRAVAVYKNAGLLTE